MLTLQKSNVNINFQIPRALKKMQKSDFTVFQKFHPLKISHKLNGIIT